jgi:hypothetical protein
MSDSGEGGVSRRKLLRRAGAIAAGAAGLAAAEGVAAERAAANDGDALILGSYSNTASGPTGLEVSDDNPGSSSYGIGVTDHGLNAFPDSAAVAGHTNGTYYFGLLGYGQGLLTSGVAGVSESGDGVYGHTNGSRYGVWGQSEQGTGVIGKGSEAGVLGIGLTGVEGHGGTSGAGVVAHNEDAASAALHVGPGRLDVDRSGIVAISYPNKTATVSVPGGLGASALVLATVQDNVGVFVKAAVPNPGAGSVQLILNKPPGSSSNPKTAHVGWLVVN